MNPAHQQIGTSTHQDIWNRSGVSMLCFNASGSQPAEGIETLIPKVRDETLKSSHSTSAHLHICTFVFHRSLLRRLFYISFFLSLFLSLSGQEPKKVRILPVPTLGYSPETKTYIGAVTLFTFNPYKDSLTRTSNAKLEFNYTWNNQYVLESEWNYFSREEKWFTKGRLHYSYYPDFYYGIGSETPESNKQLFNSNRIIGEANILRGLGKRLFIGPNFKFINYYSVSYSGEINYPELGDHSTFGVGITTLIDTRNNLLTPETGCYFNFNTGYNFSDSNYGETNIDLRIYKTLAGKYTWANRLISEYTLGDTPFFDYSSPGGDKYVRGYNYGRYRDKNLTSWQTEIRFPLFWRFGFAAFGGLSNLYHKGDFKVRNTKPNYGSGIRFLVDKRDKTSLRMDYAVGNDGNSGFYIAFGESF